MESLSLETIMQLALPADGHRVSLYMPTSRFSPSNQEKDSTRLKNLLRDAETALVARGMRAADAQALLAPGRVLLDDRPFWLRSRDGLAVLLGEDTYHVLQIAMPVPEHVHVDYRFWIRPLLPLLGRDESYWVLALSQKRVRLLEGGPSSLVEVPVERIPKSLGDALKWEDFEKASLQFHTGTSGSGGKRPAVFHGTGEPDIKNELTRFFREIERGLHEHLGKDHAPLVLAGVDYLIPLYREVNTCPLLLADAVTGNPDSLGEQLLHERSWAIAAREFRKPLEEAVTDDRRRRGRLRVSSPTRGRSLTRLRWEGWVRSSCRSRPVGGRRKKGPRRRSWFTMVIPKVMRTCSNGRLSTRFPAEVRCSPCPPTRCHMGQESWRCCAISLLKIVD